MGISLVAGLAANASAGARSRTRRATVTVDELTQDVAYLSLGQKHLGPRDVLSFDMTRVAKALAKRLVPRQALTVAGLATRNPIVDALPADWASTD